MVGLRPAIVTYRACPYRAWPNSGPASIVSVMKEATHTDPRVLFGLRLTEVRKSKGLSQERLALESGLTRSSLGGVERGQRNIALLNIYRLAGALEVQPAALFEPPSGGVKQAP